MLSRPSSRALEAPLAETFTNNLLWLIPSLNHHWIISRTLGTTWLEVAWCCLSVHPHTYTSKVNWSQSFPIPFYLEKSSDSLHQIVFSPQHQEFALTAQIKCISVQELLFHLKLEQQMYFLAHVHGRDSSGDMVQGSWMKRTGTLPADS